MTKQTRLSFMAKIHGQDEDRDIPPRHKADDVETSNRNARVQEDRGLAEEGQHLVAQKRDVPVVAAREAWTGPTAARREQETKHQQTAATATAPADGRVVSQL